MLLLVAMTEEKLARLVYHQSLALALDCHKTHSKV